MELSEQGVIQAYRNSLALNPQFFEFAASACSARVRRTRRRCYWYSPTDPCARSFRLRRYRKFSRCPGWQRCWWSRRERGWYPLSQVLAGEFRYRASTARLVDGAGLVRAGLEMPEADQDRLRVRDVLHRAVEEGFGLGSRDRARNAKSSCATSPISAGCNASCGTAVSNRCNSRCKYAQRCHNDVLRS